MADYPILFRFRHVVRSANFEAIVTANGRTVIGLEDSEWWCHGVEPGGLSENGEGPTIAFERFRASFLRALDDIAEGCSDIDAFRTDAAMLFQTDALDAQRWDTALRRIRSEVELDEPFRQLPRRFWNGSPALIIEPMESLATTPLAALEPETPALPEAA